MVSILYVALLKIGKASQLLKMFGIFDLYAHYAFNALLYRKCKAYAFNAALYRVVGP